METPQTVAEITVGLEARSVETSKYKGYEDKYAIAGSYWPPQYVIMDGDTLKPRKMVSTRGMTVNTQEYHPEPRVAAIVASHNPEFIVNVKETGMDSAGRLSRHRKTSGSRPLRRRPSCTMVAGIRPCATSWTAANAVQQDRGHRYQGSASWRPWWTSTRHRTRAVAPTSSIPSYGPVWATSALGNDKITLIGTDPEKHPE